jgi:hypothetical protein
MAGISEALVKLAMSMVSDALTLACLKSASDSATYRPFSYSEPLTMWAQSTSFPVVLLMRW